MASHSYKVVLRPCPVCNKDSHIMLEPCVYDRDGKPYRGGMPEEEDCDWIVKCENCGAITLRGESREEAIVNWENRQMTPLTWLLAV